MVKGAHWPNCGGSGIVGNSGFSVWVRSTTRMRPLARSVTKLASDDIGLLLVSGVGQRRSPAAGRPCPASLFTRLGLSRAADYPVSAGAYPPTAFLHRRRRVSWPASAGGPVKRFLRCRDKPGTDGSAGGAGAA
ncbi:hypothetical protein dqs_2133 [Azoarcus olearius]|nr:hypothetical protein dqs_2133 [Azoarcus olearius]